MRGFDIIVIRMILFVRKNQLFINFLIAGGLSALFYFVLFALLWQWLKINYQLSFSIAYLISILLHFYINRYFTFKVQGDNLFPHFIKYTCMLAINYLVTLAILRLLVERLGLTPYAGMVVGSIVNIYYNFLMSRYWVFRERKLTQV
jgi:putative flippase GtrA